MVEPGPTTATTDLGTLLARVPIRRILPVTALIFAEPGQHTRDSPATDQAVGGTPERTNSRTLGSGGSAGPAGARDPVRQPVVIRTRHARWCEMSSRRSGASHHRAASAWCSP